ncbi:hypothetical protein AgCh_027778 [Apium graveolens]
MWRVVDVRYPDNFPDMLMPIVSDYDSKLEVVAKEAVDLSCGELINLTIERFGSDRLLLYVSNRPSINHLKDPLLNPCKESWYRVKLGPMTVKEEKE